MLHDEKRRRFFRAIADLVSTAYIRNIYVMPFSFHRTRNEQEDLVRAGKSQTMDSAHRHWLAMDLVVVKDDELVWNRTNDYEVLGALWKKMGGTWGGDWKSLNDIYHFEWHDDIARSDWIED